MKNKQIKEENGITLIALIITIIILVILAAVTIRAAYTSGIIDYSINGTKKYVEEEKKEESILSNTESFMASILSKLDELGNEDDENNEKGHDWKRERDILTCTCTQCVDKNGQNGTILTIGDRLDYDYREAGGTGVTSISANKSGIAQAKLDNEEWANDYDDSQELDVTEDEVYWAVLGVEDNDKDGRNETLLLTTETPTTEEITLYGAHAYNNWIAESNRIARELYGRDARTITFDDIRNCLQYPVARTIWCDGDGCYDPMDRNDMTVSEWYFPLVNVNNPYYPDANSTTGFSQDETEESSIFGSFVLNAYFIDHWGLPGSFRLEDIGLSREPDTNDSCFSIEKKRLIFPDEDLVFQEGYWLGTIGIIENPRPWNGICFGVGFVNWEGVRSFGENFNEFGNSFANTCSFRAVVSLTSDIPDVLN